MQVFQYLMQRMCKHFAWNLRPYICRNGLLDVYNGENSVRISQLARGLKRRLCVVFLVQSNRDQDILVNLTSYLLLR